MNVKAIETWLIIGVGNQARNDDGIGWMALDKMSSNRPFTSFQKEYRYQLNIEDAELISHFEGVLIIDACYDVLENGFSFSKVTPADQFHYSTHKVDPETLAFLSGDLYEKYPEMYLLKIQGYDWALKMQLTEKALQNLQRALQFVQTLWR